MQRYEYQVISAPHHADRLRGVKSVEERFARTLAAILNRMGAQGWEYVRAEVLPCEERSGFRGVKTSFQNMLIFRRELSPAGGAPPGSGTAEDEGRGPGEAKAPLRAEKVAKKPVPVLRAPKPSQESTKRLGLPKRHVPPPVATSAPKAPPEEPRIAAPAPPVTDPAPHDTGRDSTDAGEEKNA